MGSSWGGDRVVVWNGLKRTPLARKTPLKRFKGLSPVSAKRKAEKPGRDLVRAAVFERDGWSCRIAPLVGTACFGVLTVHHLRKASAGGEYVEANLLTACASHNSFVEDEPKRARALGLVA